MNKSRIELLGNRTGIFGDVLTALKADIAELEKMLSDELPSQEVADRIMETERNIRHLRDLHIRYAYLAGLPGHRLAKMYDLSSGRISQIVNKKD